MPLPFIDSTEKAEECVSRIATEAGNGKGQPIVFSTLVNHDVRGVLRRADALFIDFFESFIDPLEAALGVKSSHTIGRSHSAMDKKEYQQRIEAINFAMAHDDGASHREDLENGEVPYRPLADGIHAGEGGNPQQHA